MLVTIERIEHKKNGEGSVYAIVHLEGGQRVYCWDGKVIGALQAGAVYEVEVKEGRFPRLVKARPVASTNGAGETIVSREGRQALEASAAERLEALRLVLTLAQWTRLDSVDAALAAADKVLQWLKEGGGR
ncbi:MAG: hypothetical protein NZ695_01915 [Dehalococcoidia bacterium]|nr:hypothetical protein [Dehalococcoidia bacterium]